MSLSVNLHASVNGGTVRFERSSRSDHGWFEIADDEVGEVTIFVEDPEVFATAVLAAVRRPDVTFPFAGVEGAPEIDDVESQMKRLGFSQADIREELERQGMART